MIPGRRVDVSLSYHKRERTDRGATILSERIPDIKVKSWYRSRIYPRIVAGLLEHDQTRLQALSINVTLPHYDVNGIPIALSRRAKYLAVQTVSKEPP